MKPLVYDDFGHVINGAKKFNYTSNEPTHNYNSETVYKNDLWPEPQIGQKDLFVEFLISKFRNCIRASFKSDNTFLVDEYISQVLALKSLMENARSEDEVLAIIRRLDYERDDNGNLLFNKKLILTKKIKFWEFTRSQMEIEGFGLTEEEKQLRKAKSVLKSYIINNSYNYNEGSLQFSDGKNRYTFPLNPELTKEKLIIGKLVVIKEGIVIAINQSLEDYENLLTDYINESKVSKTKKHKRLKTPYLDRIRHEGSDYRLDYDVLPDALKDKFSFYGGQFGNWLSQKERAAVINLAYDSFSDLAYALQIRNEDISFNQKLSIAFGARGSGKGTAHYEPQYRIINLTKLKGAGSLCHEWGHALDHMMAEYFGYKNTLLTNQSEIPLKSLKALVDELNDIKNPYKLDSLSLDMYEGRKKPYWSQTSEMFARAFNVYVIDKLYLKNVINDYLCYEFDISIDLEDGRWVSANPHGKERDKLNRLFDDLIKELKEIGILHEKEKFSGSKSSHAVGHCISQANTCTIYYL